MEIRVDAVRIAGFRGIENLEISLPRVTVLIGTNNSGKTSLLKALQLSLGDYSRFLSEEDLYIGSDENRATEILVDVRIVSIGIAGNRSQKFNEEWATEFGDKIKAEANGEQYVAIRTLSKPNLVKGGFDTLRFTLEKWPDYKDWQIEKVKKSPLRSRFLSIPFVSIEAQRDVHQELKEKTSFVGRVLSSVEYDKADVATIESQIKDVNNDAVGKSTVLKNLKLHLESLNQSFQGTGNAEITPFPKKIRDLSKHFTVHFGENGGGVFSMEYHGMGTRSWASMLTVKAFTDMMAEKHAIEAEPFFPIIAAEEPEAHLHPSAQKTLYRQLAQSKGQVLMSTHSPYLAAMSSQHELRCLQKSPSSISVCCLSLESGTEEYRRLQREIIHSRGELLFTKVLVLCEGETEEQALPILFKKYFCHDPFELGVSVVGVGGSGKKYLPFLTFARDFSIPVFVFSDGEVQTTNSLKTNYEQVFGNTDVADCPNITILDNTDFEGYLISSGYITTLEATIEGIDGVGAIERWIKKRHGSVSGKTCISSCVFCKQKIISGAIQNYKTSDGYHRAILQILHSGKTRFAPAIADELCKLEVECLPPKFIEFFEKIDSGAEI